MSLFTVVIIIWAIYQLVVSVTKKNGTQQTPGTSRGTWREQLKQALENGPYQAGSLESTTPKDFEEIKDYHVETEGNQGTEGTSEHIGILGLEAYKSTEETPREEMARNPSGLSGVHLSLTERELVQGIMWAEILGKPRAMRPFRGPRT